MSQRARPVLSTLLLVLGISAPLAAQQPTQPPAAPTPEVGTMAPDFTITGATRFGVLRDSIRLSDYRGQTVVLACFFKARTRG